MTDFCHLEPMRCAQGELRRSAALQCGILRPFLAARITGGLLSVALAGAIALGTHHEGMVLTLLFLLFVGELLDRCLFFMSVSPARMPGQP